ARSVAELRAAGVGVDRVLMLHDGGLSSMDLFQSVLTMLDPQVALTLVPVGSDGQPSANGEASLQPEKERAEQLGRHIQVHPLAGDSSLGPEVVRLAREGQYDLVILALPPERPSGKNLPVSEWVDYLLDHVHCPVFLAAAPRVPQETAD